ncbi:MAG: hypothetical protein Q7T82_00985 [Armatimonadota bacterium]|nr:hypothetical protein [Armatimonadota bacterium]
MGRVNRLLRPMTLLDILDGAFDIYKTNLATLIGIVAVIYAPVQALATVARIFVGSHNPLASTLIDLAYIPVLTVASFLVMGPSMWAISEAYLGHKISVVAAYRRMLPRVFSFGITYLLWLVALLIPYLFGALIIGAGIGFGIALIDKSPVMVLAIIAAVFLGLSAMLIGVGFYVSLIFTCPSFVAEDRRYFSALRRSWQLIKGYYWRTLGIVLLAFFLIIVILQGVCIAALLAATGLLKDMLLHPQTASLGTPYILYQIGAMITSIAIEPVWLITIILVYYDLRIRKEGFDLQALAAEMGYRDPEPAQAAPAYAEAAPGPATASQDPQQRE